MYFVSQLLFAIIISSLTSTLLLLTWRLMRQWFMRVNPKLVNVSLQIVCVTYLLPIGYVASLLTKYRWLKGMGSTWKLYFARTRHITVAISIIALIWLVIVCFRFRKYYMQYRMLREKLKDNIPIKGELASEVFYRVCKELGIPEGKVSLQRNPLMETPLIVRVYKSQVLLPDWDYTEKELELIFYHELSHYKNHDLKWRLLILAITILHGFNPFVRPLISIVSFWGECMADVSALEASGNVHNAKKYFEIIERLMPESSKQEMDKYPFVALCRSNKVMVKRVEFIQRYQHAHICSRQTEVGLLAIFSLALTMLAVGVGIGFADLHKFVYKATENGIKIQIAEDGMEEYYVKGEKWILNLQPISIQPDGIWNTDGESFYSLRWEVEKNTCQTTGSFCAKSGQRVDLSVGVRFIEVDYKIGILNENGEACYIQSQGSISHNFNIAKTGKYRIFIKNNSANESIPYILVNYKLQDRNAMAVVEH